MNKLGYLKIVNLGAHAFSGGLMIVDTRGLPQDFRYTDPVNPSKVQQILYGKALDRHVRQDVIFKHLAEKMEPRPALLLVDDELLVGLAASVPVVLLTETRLAPMREVAQLQPVTETEYLLQAGETGSPLRMKFAKNEPGLPEKVAALLLEAVANGMDPVEPFVRIRGAVDTLCAPSSAHE
jgi:hypothetical protein